MELGQTFGDAGLLLFSFSGLVATAAAIARDTRTQRAELSEILPER